jgi:hypothetical protein
MVQVDNNIWPIKTTENNNNTIIKASKQSRSNSHKITSSPRISPVDNQAVNLEAE